MLVAKWEPTPCYHDAYSVGTPNWAFRVKGWLTHCKTTISPLFGRFFLVCKRTFFVRVLIWMFHIGRARYPGLVRSRFFTLGQLSFEFAHVGGWLTSGDLALDSCAQFLAVAEHRLIPSRARSVGHQLRKAGFHSGLGSCLSGSGCWWSCWCWCGQSWRCLPVSPSFVTPQFQEFFRLGRVFIFLLFRFSGSREDAEKSQLTDRFFKLSMLRLRWLVLVNLC